MEERTTLSFREASRWLDDDQLRSVSAAWMFPSGRRYISELIAEAKASGKEPREPMDQPPPDMRPGGKAIRVRPDDTPESVGERMFKQIQEMRGDAASEETGGD